MESWVLVAELVAGGFLALVGFNWLRGLFWN
jgi:hypothetical protein